MTSATLEAIQAELAAHAHGRVPRELRHRQLLAVARELFVERGYAGTSMDELAARAGVSKPVIYDLLGSKEAAFGACMAAASDELATSVAAAVTGAGDDPAARLRAGARAWFDFIDAHRGIWESLLASSDAPATEAIAAIRTRQDAFVAAELAAGATEFAAGDGLPVDPELAGAVATAMNGAFEALGRWWHDHPDRTAAELAELYTALVLPGLTALLEWVPAD